MSNRKSDGITVERNGKGAFYVKEGDAYQLACVIGRKPIYEMLDPDDPYDAAIADTLLMQALAAGFPQDTKAMDALETEYVSDAEEIIHALIGGADFISHDGRLLYAYDEFDGPNDPSIDPLRNPYACYFDAVDVNEIADYVNDEDEIDIVDYVSSGGLECDFHYELDRTALVATIEAHAPWVSASNENIRALATRTKSVTPPREATFDEMANGLKNGEAFMSRDGTLVHPRPASWQGPLYRTEAERKRAFSVWSTDILTIQTMMWQMRDEDGYEDECLLDPALESTETPSLRLHHTLRHDSKSDMAAFEEMYEAHRPWVRATPKNVVDLVPNRIRRTTIRLQAHCDHKMLDRTIEWTRSNLMDKFPGIDSYRTVTEGDEHGLIVTWYGLPKGSIVERNVKTLLRMFTIQLDDARVFWELTANPIE